MSLGPAEEHCGEQTEQGDGAVLGMWARAVRQESRSRRMADRVRRPWRAPYVLPDVLGARVRRRTVGLKPAASRSCLVRRSLRPSSKAGPSTTRRSWECRSSSVRSSAGGNPSVVRSGSCSSPSWRSSCSTSRSTTLGSRTFRSTWWSASASSDWTSRACDREGAGAATPGLGSFDATWRLRPRARLPTR